MIIFVSLRIKHVPMKLRLSFTFRIILPYLIIAAFFLAIFIREITEGDSPVIWLSAGGLLATMILAALHNRWLGMTFQRARSLIGKLARGTIPDFKATDSGGEVGELEGNLEKHVSRMRDVASFARALASGDFTGRFDKLGREDELGDSMLSLKHSLVSTLEESESRRREEEYRTWSAQGIARFSNLFREAEDNLEGLSCLLMKELVEYTEADIGALFIARDREDGGKRILEISGSYAFDRQKHVRRSFEFGEGLVGRVAQEKEPVYITDLPPDYIKIRSGLGEEAPGSILLVPVLLDNQVLGIIELASLGEMPSHQIDFIRRLGEALATTLSRMKANLRTRELFEQTSKQAEKLASQEKVFRQQMQQMEQSLEAYATRESALRKEIEQLRKRPEKE